MIRRLAREHRVPLSDIRVDHAEVGIENDRRSSAETRKPGECPAFYTQIVSGSVRYFFFFLSTFLSVVFFVAGAFSFLALAFASAAAFFSTLALT